MKLFLYSLSYYYPKVLERMHFALWRRNALVEKEKALQLVGAYRSILNQPGVTGISSVYIKRPSI